MAIPMVTGLGGQGGHFSLPPRRVLLDSSRTGSPVVTERVLLQPFHMLLALERNLCSWYTKVPTLAVNLTMGQLAVSGCHYSGVRVQSRLYTYLCMHLHK